MRRRNHRPVLHRGARRIFSKKVVVFPIRRRSGWSRDKPTAAIRTDISRQAFDTGHTEGAFIRTDARFKRVGRQRLVAVFARGPEFKHGVRDVKRPITGNQWFLEHFSAALSLSHPVADRRLTSEHRETELLQPDNPAGSVGLSIILLIGRHKGCFGFSERHGVVQGIEHVLF